ncbi:MAG: DinB family protein, partial [Candidatus Dormibacteraeota bacterium]|nr:DinB family protein [Candidatus Dormibacteraeota bacterium]
QIVAHLASAELGEAFLMRRALEGEVVHMNPEDRDLFNESQVEGVGAMSLDELRGQLAAARDSLREIFQAMSEEDLDRVIRWPEWPARTIRTSIPYMLEHEDSHLDELRTALPQLRAS